jgi:hypothetical protein
VLPPDAATWLSTVLTAHYRDNAHGDGGSAHVPQTPAGLLANEAAALRGTHRKLVDEGATPQAAATYLVGWFAGAAAEVVGLMLARAGAGLLLDAADLTWRLNEPDGWPEQVEIASPRVLLTADHPWAGTPGAVVAGDREAVRNAAVAALVEFSQPIVDACRGLARVGRTGLWDEVADGLGIIFRHAPDVTQEMLDELLAAVAAPGTPWRARPRLGWAHSEVLGRIHVAQKGGCCLYFTCKKQHAEPVDRSGWDAAELAYHERFAHRPGEKHYCSTCRFRDPADVVARRTYWRELCHVRDRHAQEQAG